MEKISIGNKKFVVKKVSTKEDMIKGLGGTASLPSGEGMLFDFDKEEDVTMNMFEMKYPLDMVFMNNAGEVIKTVTMEPGENTVTVDNARYVLEVNKGEGVFDDIIEEVKEEKNSIINSDNLPESLVERFQSGGSFKIYEEDVKAIPGNMHVLDDTGKVQMNIVGGERIFSIDHTEQLISSAKKVKTGELPPEELGKLMTKIIYIQNNQKPEYVN